MAFTIGEISKDQYLIPLKIILVYLLWKVFHHFALTPGNSIFLFWCNFSTTIGAQYAHSTSIILRPFVDQSHSVGIAVLYHKGSDYRTVLVQEHCLAIPAMVIFTSAIIMFKGSWQDKAWFIPLGLMGIILINLLRLLFVCLAWLHLSQQFFDLHHSVIYVIITYGFIFLMARWWMNRVMLQKADINIQA